MITTVIGSLVALSILVLLAVFAGFKKLWNSTAFWFVAFLVTIGMFPLTAGMSPLALIGLFILRVVILGRVFRAGR